jgi:hypothetical protein
VAVVNAVIALEAVGGDPAYSSRLGMGWLALSGLIPR